MVSSKSVLQANSLIAIVYTVQQNTIWFPEIGHLAPEIWADTMENHDISLSSAKAQKVLDFLKL